MNIRLACYRVTWSDGKALEIHARTGADAREFAEKLDAPAGAVVVDVEEVQ